MDALAELQAMADSLKMKVEAVGENFCLYDATGKEVLTGSADAVKSKLEDMDYEKGMEGQISEFIASGKTDEEIIKILSEDIPGAPEPEGGPMPEDQAEADIKKFVPSVADSVVESVIEAVDIIMQDVIKEYELDDEKVISGLKKTAAQLMMSEVSTKVSKIIWARKLKAKDLGEKTPGEKITKRDERAMWEEVVDDCLEEAGAIGEDIEGMASNQITSFLNDKKQEVNDDTKPWAKVENQMKSEVIDMIKAGWNLAEKSKVKGALSEKDSRLLASAEHNVRYAIQGLKKEPPAVDQAITDLESAKDNIRLVIEGEM